MPTSTTSDGNTVRPEEATVDVLALKELAKRALVDALNSVLLDTLLYIPPTKQLLRSMARRRWYWIPL